MYGLRHEIIPPSGVEHAELLHLTPSSRNASSSGFTSKRVIGNLVVARSNFLRIFEVREEPAPLPTLEEAEARATAGSSKLGTEAVEGEIEMDTEGEGFVNMAQVKSLPTGVSITPSTITRLYLIREHRLHGVVTGLGAVKTITSVEDGLDRLLISFCDAKISLMEWSEVLHDITTVSLHTYERAPQVLTSDSKTWRARLRIDPLSRCAALSLPKEAFAILPFHTSAELDMMDQDRALGKDIPYAPSFVLEMNDVDSRIKNIVDYVFIPGFNNPTLAIAFQTVETWTGRLNEYKDTVSVFVISIDSITRTCPIISQINGMPYDVLYLVACPANLGGIFLVTSNAIVHVDQTSRTVGVAVNGWANRTTAIHLPVQMDDASDAPLELKLEGSQMTFLRDDAIVLVLADGTIRRIIVTLEGRAITKVEVSPVIAQTVPAAVLCVADSEGLFIGSIAGPSVLVKAAYATEVVEKTATAAAIPDDLEMELDEDIYGDMATQAMAADASRPDVETRTVLKLSLHDSLPAHGVISHMAFGVTVQDDRPSPELIACTGVGTCAGFTRFTNHLPTRTKRKIPVVGGRQGIWSMCVKPSSASKAKNKYIDGQDTIIVSTNAHPSPGISRVLAPTSGGDIHILSRTPGVTITAAAFFQNTRFAQVLTDNIRLMDAEGRERLAIKDPTLPPITAAYISDPFIIVRREDDSVNLYVGDTMEGKISLDDRVALPPCRSASLFTDHTGLFKATGLRDSINHSDEATESLENVLDSDRGTRWVLLLLTSGEMQIRSLPNLTIVFSTPSLGHLPPLLSHAADAAMGQEISSGESSPIEQLCITPLGDTSDPKLCLTVLATDSILVAYEVLPQTPAAQADGSLSIRFLKIFTRILEVLPPAPTSDSSRKLVPFSLDNGDLAISGIYCTGDKPFWLVSRRFSSLRLYSAANSVVHAFAPSSIVGGKGDFLVYSDEGATLMQWVGDVQLGMELAYRTIYTPRQYTSVMYHPATQHVIAVSTQQAHFTYFDDDGKNGWAGNAPGISQPNIESASLELLSPDTWTSIDGYEFAQNEFVNAAEVVSLETLSAERGEKDFVVVGTTIYRGEDLAVKGATYVFEVVEVVREPGSLKRRNKLKLLCRDESKGPVTAVCGMNGYLVSSMGQKIYVRAFDLDERLVGMAFLDVGLYVTSLRSLKNLLLISDAVKSVWFVCFQEDPFKLIVLSKDPETISASNANFFFGEDGELSFITSDEHGVIRVYDYNPMDPESNSGQRLICQTEFDGQNEHRTVLTVARRPVPMFADQETMEEALPAQAQSILVCATLEGSISVLSPLDAARYKRLSLLQGQLVRNVQHVAGLNPKAFRTVRNDKVSRPLTKGILDGPLLSAFGDLAVERQIEATKQIGTERTVLLEDLRDMWKCW